MLHTLIAKLTTVSDQVLKDRANEITLNTKHDGYQKILGSMVN